MEEILAQILHACKLASELEANLPDIATEPHFLLGACDEIVAAFTKAIQGIVSRSCPPPFSAPLFLQPRLDLSAGEGSSHGPSYMRPIDLYGSQAMGEGGPLTFHGPGRPENEMGFPQFPQLALEITTSAPATGVMELGGGQSGGGGGAHHGTDAEGSSRSGRGPVPPAAAPPVQRSPRRRRRGSGIVVTRVPALRTGNMEIPPDDGYTWRKYGQKAILGSRHPRSYYRCTHKNYYGCEAKKQVQRLDEDPYTYEVTYCGRHSCQTSTTPLIIPPIAPPAGDDSSSNPQGEAPMPGASQPPPSLSTSIQLGSWISELSTRGIQALPIPHGEGSSSRAGPSQMPAAGRDGDCPVADLADAMFNSGSSGSSMDAIFSPSRREN